MSASSIGTSDGHCAGAKGGPGTGRLTRTRIDPGEGTSIAYQSTSPSGEKVALTPAPMGAARAGVSFGSNASGAPPTVGARAPNWKGSDHEAFRAPASSGSSRGPPSAPYASIQPCP